MNFLDALTADDMAKSLPIKSLLENSLYYPGCGFDGTVIKYVNTTVPQWGITSYVYCDYGISEQALEERQDTFRGYNILGSRQVDVNELIPNGWTPVLPPGINPQAYLFNKNNWEAPYARWIVYERSREVGEEHGPRRFSLLYLGGEGVATYQALYWTNNLTAKAVAVFEHGWGGNWTDFGAPHGPLEWVLKTNLAGIPGYIYYNQDDLQWKCYELLHRGRDFTIWRRQIPC
jgi:hypothetical protein